MLSDIKYRGYKKGDCGYIDGYCFNGEAISIMVIVNNKIKPISLMDDYEIID